ncbi:uncharacterized protein LOC106761273 isoform X1 [Vigna radiata var. radiata]|uniref:Uncharacterized protein LOC106761273 isoform X1 n=1 Tax=Vigna radiata var. radiata TaxID=3916 RepID=A0A3Q0EX08_VIGRR|nr:uncharacterized protein LOC106761273 isoform X1 [Vigna radiata var. radiata]
MIQSDTEAQSTQFTNAKKLSSEEEKSKMATVPPPSPPPRSTSDSGNTSPTGKVEAATNNGNCHVDDKKPNFTDGLDHLDSPQCIERFRKYDNDYAHRLLAKYFSNKNLYGDTKPIHWLKWLCWAEYWYNTNYHEATKTTPLKALYGRYLPPVIRDVSTTPMNKVAVMIQDRNEVTVKWKNMSNSENSWESLGNMMEAFSELHLEDKVNFKGRH